MTVVDSIKSLEIWKRISQNSGPIYFYLKDSDFVFVYGQPWTYWGGFFDAKFGNHPDVMLIQQLEFETVLHSVSPEIQQVLLYNFDLLNHNNPPRG